MKQVSWHISSCGGRSLPERFPRICLTSVPVLVLSTCALVFWWIVGRWESDFSSWVGRVFYTQASSREVKATMKWKLFKQCEVTFVLDSAHRSKDPLWPYKALGAVDKTLSTSRKDMGSSTVIARAVNKELLRALKDSKVKKHNASLEQLTQRTFKLQRI